MTFGFLLGLIKNKKMTFEQIIDELHQLANPDKVAFKMQKFGIVAHNALGVYQADLKEIAKKTGRNNDLAIQLFDSGIYECRILCSKIYDPKSLNEEVIEKWVRTFENWEICDSFCMGLFAKSDFALPKIKEWSTRKKEFEKRAAFATMAAYCMAAKKADNEVFESFFPLIKNAAKDERIYVKKAVNWALRNIGKRNIDLHQTAKKVATEIAKIDHKAAKWIAKDALKEFGKEKINILDYPRAIYRPN